MKTLTSQLNESLGIQEALNNDVRKLMNWNQNFCDEVIGDRRNQDRALKEIGRRPTEAPIIFQYIDETMNILNQIFLDMESDGEIRPLFKDIKTLEELYQRIADQSNKDAKALYDMVRDMAEIKVDEDKYWEYMGLLPGIAAATKDYWE